MARNDERTIRTIDAVSGRRANAEAYASDARGAMQFRDTCGKCGAVRVDRQIGLEPTPDLYLQTMVQVFREVRRVLRRDGTCWVNMGDSYSGGKQGRGDRGPADLARQAAQYGRGKGAFTGPNEFQQRQVPEGYKPKDLLLMPARLALALQADGWWIRSDVIWHKPNPMPESATDRPTSAHEHVFLLTRSARYYYDADAVREDAEYGRRESTATWCDKVESKGRFKTGSNSVGVRLTETTSGRHPETGRSCRNVWTIATSPFSAAHFATFPPELAERCIKAGTSERGCCAACGKPWQRIVDKPKPPREVFTQRNAPTDEMIYSGTRVDGVMVGSGQKLQNWRDANPAVTTGWSPGCQCNAATVPCTVLDPFIGAGTTALVADRLQRDCIGIDLNTQYTRMAMDRCIADAPLFTSFPPAEDPEETRMADLFTDMAAD